MAPRSVIVLFWLGFASGCTGAPDDKGDPTETGLDDTGGGGTGSLWRAAGSGTAYFADGSVDNSLFHLELTRCVEPREGEAYYGWVSKAGLEPIGLGEITVDAEEVYFEGDIGVNAIIEGYDTFEAWAGADAATAQESGTELWAGRVDTVVYDVIQTLVIASDDTPDGQGSLRSVETAVQALRDEGQTALDATFDQDSFTATCEGIANALEGVDEDRNDDGTTSTIPDQFGVLNEGGYIDLILADLTAASAQVDPGNPIKDYANYAYDCAQNIETHALIASIDADVGSVCLSEETCDIRLQDALTELDYALDGEDVDENGSIDLLEGTIECAIGYVSQMAQMTVEVP
jgi:hypothetical protein